MAQYRTDTDSLDPAMRNRYEVMMIADINGNPSDTAHPLPVRFGDSDSITAFGRGRVATARLLGEYRYMYGSGTSIEMNDKLVGAGAITPDYTKCVVYGTVGTASGDRVVRQTKQYHPYIAGTSNVAYITFTMGARKANLQQMVGLFDDSNGIFFRMNGVDAEVVIRKNGVDTEVIQQANWNVDNLSGNGPNDTNPSGLTIDFTKSQILIIDYQWLGVGRVRIGFMTAKGIVYVHHFNHQNVVIEPYTAQPSYPCRWELVNTGVTASASSLTMICASVYCEGSENETGFSKSVSTDGTGILVNANGAAGGKGVLAVRLKNTLVGKQNHALARLKNLAIYSNVDVQYKVVVLPGSAMIAGTPTWTQVPGYSWCEYTTNFSLATGWMATNNYNVLVDNFVSGGQGSNTGQSGLFDLDNRSNAIYQNYDATDSQILAIVGFRLGNDATVNASLGWLEVK